MPFDSRELPIHFARHGADFGVGNDKAYEDLAEKFLAAQSAPHYLECTRRGGDFVRYDTITMEFAVKSIAGTIRTYFKPRPCGSLPIGAPKVNCHGYLTNTEYFRRSC